MMKKSCRNALKEALDIHEAAALEYRLTADEMMENMDWFWEEDDGERMRKASNAYDDASSLLQMQYASPWNTTGKKIYIINDFKRR